MFLGNINLFSIHTQEGGGNYLLCASVCVCIYIYIYISSVCVYMYTYTRNKINNLLCCRWHHVMYEVWTGNELILERVEEVNNKYGLTINRSKTNVMVIDQADNLPHITATNHIPLLPIYNSYQKVDQFSNLGSIIQTDGGSSRQIRHQIILERRSSQQVNTDLKEIFRNNKLQLLKALIFLVMLYGSQTQSGRCKACKFLWDVGL